MSKFIIFSVYYKYGQHDMQIVEGRNAMMRKLCEELDELDEEYEESSTLHELIQQLVDASTNSDNEWKIVRIVEFTGAFKAFGESNRGFT